MSDRKFILQFIAHYRGLSELWDRHSEQYADRNARAAAYLDLLQFYRTRYPRATRQTLVKKINSLRVNFRREYNKVQWSRKSGGPVYKPILYYYEDMHAFLEEQMAEYEGNASLLDEQDLDTVGLQNEVGEETAEIHFVEENGDYEAVWLQDSKVLQQSSVTLDQRPARPAASAVPAALARDSEEMILARAYALKLTKMTDDQRIFADKLINDVLAEGQLGGLSRASKLVAE